MSDSGQDDNIQFRRGPSESWDEWISRVAAHSLTHSKETDVTSAGQSDGMLNDIQSVLSYGANETENVEPENDNKDPVNLEDQKIRIEKLKEIFQNLAQLWWVNSKLLDSAAEILADGSRDYRWRIPMGDSGILTFFLEIFSRHHLGHNIKIQILRLIGNCCADKDENRRRIAESKNYMLSIIQQLKDASLLSYALPVLFNICVDYEPNQLLASNALLTRGIIELLDDPTFNRTQSYSDFIARILTLLISHPSEADNAPDNTAAILVRIAADHNSPVDLDIFISLINTAISYLQHEKFQLAFISDKGSLDYLAAILVDSYTRFDNETSSIETDDTKALISMRTSLNQVLADISDLPEFAEICPISSHFSNSLQQWLYSQKPKSQLQVCACIILGNLARHDATCIEFVQISQVHMPLIDIISKESSSQVLHAALGFLKNLAIPFKNKNAIGEAGIFPVLSRVWALETMPQVKLFAVTLGRLLTIDAFENVNRLIFEDSSEGGTNFSSLMDLFSSTHDESIKMEVARLSTSICRVLYSQSETFWEKKEPHRKMFLAMNPEICHQFGFLITQTKWPAVRSEVWFVLALIARSPDSAAFISCLLNDAKIFESLSELLAKSSVADVPSSQSPSLHNDSTATQSHLISSPVNTLSHTANMVQKNSENALVLVSEILKNSGSEITKLQRTKLSDLLKSAGGILLGKEQRKTEVKSV